MAGAPPARAGGAPARAATVSSAAPAAAAPAAAHSAPARAATSTCGVLVLKIRTNALALTIDDGPHPTWTPRVLDLLAEHGVRAVAPDHR